jgi:hypothetical protein
MPSSAGLSPEAYNPPPTTFDTIDLMLMNYYTTETSLQMFYGERQCKVWQRDIPALAGSNVMLMHGILSVAALHRGRDDPAQRNMYRARSLYHHDTALQQFKTLVALADPRNAEVLLSFSVLLGIWVYAFPETAADDESLGLDDLLDMLEVIRGTKTVFVLYRDVIASKPIGVFIIPAHKYWGHPPPELQALAAHQALDHLSSTSALPSHNAAIHHLRMSLDRYLAGLDHARSAAGWISVVEDDFWQSLRAHDPQAILIFAHNAMLLRYSERGYWWMMGWSDRILRACDRALSPEQKQALDWEGCLERIQVAGDEVSSLPVPELPHG